MTASFFDETDLICGFHLDPDGGLARVPPGDIAAASARRDGITWLHFNIASAKARRWIADQLELPPAAAEILLDADDTRSRMHPQDGGLVAVLSDLHHDFAFDPADIGTLRLYMDANRVISCRRHPLKTVDRLRKSIEEGRRFHSTAALLAELVERQAEALGAVVDDVTDQVDDIEDHTLAGHDRDERARLGALRRLAMRLRRQIAPQRLALRRLGTNHPAWMVADDLRRLHEANDELDKVLYDLEAVQDRAKMVQEEMAARLSEEVNASLYVLSVVTVVFAPATFITGLFGMNVDGLPLVHGGPRDFWWVMLLILAALGLTLALVRKRLPFGRR